jgi:Flp pilus assembly protein TadG
MSRAKATRSSTHFCSRAVGRRGIVTVLAAIGLAAVFAFVAFAVDTGMIVMTQTDMQNAVDAAALAASQEITAAVEEGATIGSGSIAEANAREIAEEVAAANGVFIDPNEDVYFGKRLFDEATNTWPIEWGAEPYNVVKVVGRRDQQDVELPDGEIKLAFGWAVGKASVPLTVSAAAFVEARDIAMVLDYSGSMNFDSQFRSASLSSLGQSAIEANLADIWEDLGSPMYGNLPFQPDYVTVPKTPANIKWKGTSVEISYNQTCSDVYLDYTSWGGQYFSGGSAGQTETFQGTGSYSGRMIEVAWVKRNGSWTPYDFYNSYTIEAALGLDSIPYPYQSGSWDNYIDYCRDSTGSTSWYDYDIYATGYRRKFGMLTLVEFWISKKKKFNETEDLWKTRHYPFHAVKEGASLLCEFLDDLEFGDHLGLVTYDTNSRIETGLNESGMPVVNLGSELITDNYSDIDTIQSHKQAAHYGHTTNIGGGLDDAIDLLTNYGRYGARPTIILMTDGNANVKDPSWSLPSGWNWNELTDYDGDGFADYTTSNQYKLYAIGKAKEAVDLGCTIHTMSVGASSDRDMMEAIAFIGGGIAIDIPGGSTVSEMESQVLDAFNQIAAKVPPAKLVYAE